MLLPYFLLRFKLNAKVEASSDTMTEFKIHVYHIYLPIGRSWPQAKTLNVWLLEPVKKTMKRKPKTSSNKLRLNISFPHGLLSE